MTTALRVLLIFMSVLSFFYVSYKLRKAEMSLIDTIFWISLGGGGIVISVFPQIVIWGAELFGFMAPVNFIFLLVLCLLLTRNFLLTVRVSMLEEKMQHLIQELAIRKNLEEGNESGKENESKFL